MGTMENFLSKVRRLRPPVRSLMFLYWIYTFSAALSLLFIQIFLFERFSNLPLNVSATMIYYTGLMLGFAVCGTIAGSLHINMKRGFLWSFVIMAVALVFIFRSDTAYLIYASMFLNGLGHGVFWLTLHCFELTETTDEERDFYASMLSAGSQLLSLAGPAVATLLIWLSGSVLHWNDFTLIFVVTPLVYVLGFFCFHHIHDYYPAPITEKDVIFYLNDARNRISQIYMVSTGVQHLFGIVIPPLVAFYLLSTPLSVGVFNTLFAVLSAVCVLVVAEYRTTGNRLLIMGLAAAGSIVLTVWLAYSFDIAALIIYAAGMALFLPLLGVSNYVINLRTMESIGRPETDFFPTLIFRDVSLWIGRTLAGFLILGAAQLWPMERHVLSAGLYLLAAAWVVVVLGAYLLLRAQRPNERTPR